jgi:SAM-dependent methyltransferase
MNNTTPPSDPVTDPRIAFFDRHAPTWDATGPDPAATLRRLRELNGRLGLRPGLEVLELGCGTGQITGWLVDLVKPGKVVAADFSPAMLEQARSRGWAADLVWMDICREEPVKRQFDVVLCFHSFPHFRDQPAALRQIARLLKPGGQLLVLHLVGSVPLNAFHHQVGGAVGHDRLPPAAEWPALLGPAGLHLSEVADREDLFLVRAYTDADIDRRPSGPLGMAPAADLQQEPDANASGRASGHE